MASRRPTGRECITQITAPSDTRTKQYPCSRWRNGHDMMYPVYRDSSRREPTRLASYNHLLRSPHLPFLTSSNRIESNQIKPNQDIDAIPSFQPPLRLLRRPQTP
ncbi:hypothetical protein PMIN06_004542 [Paraphaeosphaeria minitans]